MNSKKDSILSLLLNETFKNTNKQIENNYFTEELKNVEKWICYSDYCFDDNNKPNNVVTFSILPIVDDIKKLECFIKETAKKDIKKTQTINPKFVKFLNKYPLVNFSFILNDRFKIFGQTHNDRKNRLKKDFEATKEMYNLWIKNQPKKKKEYKKVIKKINRCIELINSNKKIKQLIDIMLISFLGGYCSNIILNKLNNLKLYGWFSDRDKLFDIENGLVANFFHNTLHGLIDDKNFQFGTAIADCNFDIFYDEFIKIPDYIAGTLADYNMTQNVISKDKFNTMLTDYMGDNEYNNYIFSLSVEKSNISFNKIEILKK